jgi:hypothetical protein
VLPGPFASVKVAAAVISLEPDAASAGTVTSQLVCAVWPGCTDANVDGEVAVAVHPAGTASETLTLVSGWLLVSGIAVVTVAVVPGVTMAGAVSASGCCTTTGVVPVTPLTVTLIVATPWPTAVSMPVLLTAATFGLLLE